MSKTTMKAVVFKGKLDVRIEDRPIPKIIDQTDIIIKVRYSALCGRYVRFGDNGLMDLADQTQ
jgi:threonine dehydrogenase-like Zn-dependent dehydrogenase